MMSCREVVKLVSEDLDHPLSLRRRIALRFHTMMCGSCARYRRQLRALERLLRGPAARAIALAGTARQGEPIDGLSDAGREAIRRLLKS